MQTRHITLALAVALCTQASIAQKKNFTMAEATNGIATTLAPKSVKQPMWRPGSHQFFYRSEDGTLMMYNADSKDGVIRDTCCGAYTNRKSGFQWLQNNVDYLISGDTLSIHSTKSNGAQTDNVTFNRSLPKGAANIHVEPLTKTYAFTKENNLFYGKYNDSPFPITADTNRNIINGQAVHRNEFGIEEGIFFSPKGNYLAYYHMDQTMVKDYPVIDWSTVPAHSENVKYPMAGGTSHEVTLRVYNIKTGETVELKTGTPKDHYLTCVTWSPDEQYLYLAILNRDQNHLWLNQYSAKTGEKIKTILQEADDKYVEPEHPLSFLPGSNMQFIWWSQRDGYMHLWLGDLAKNSMRCLTPGDYVVNELIGFNARTKEVLLTSAKEDPREKHGYAVNWETGKMRRLDTEPGTHNYMASDDGEYLFDVFTAAKIPKRSVIRSSDGTIIKTLVDSPNPLADYDRPKILDVKFSNVDGPEFYGKLILPTNFDSTQKYPVIVYLYNGPHVQLIKNAFPGSGNLWYEYLAQHGYIVWTMDGYGSSNRGLDFEQKVFRRLGTFEMESQLIGVDHLKSLPYVDTSRMGVHGWSFGGFMTTSLMLRHPGVFKVAVAGGPVMDWSMYEVMYGERYMDTPQDNPEGYAENNLLTKVSNLQGKLLLIHGAQDATVVWQHSINFIRECVSKGVQVDYFVYPGYEHNVRGKDRVHLMQKITDYFDDYLK